MHRIQSTQDWREEIVSNPGRIRISDIRSRKRKRGAFGDGNITGSTFFLFTAEALRARKRFATETRKLGGNTSVINRKVEQIPYPPW